MTRQEINVGDRASSFGLDIKGMDILLSALKIKNKSNINTVA